MREERTRSGNERQHLVDNIPIVKYYAEMDFQKAGREGLARIAEDKVNRERKAEGMICSVCWESFQSNETVKALPCGHVYHQKCIDTWLLRFASLSSCPLW